MQTEIVKVTPALAKSWLETNKENQRRVREARVNFYAKEMVEGRWKESTGESVKFDRKGKLIDGQHRLLAIVKANYTGRFLIVRNLDPEVFNVIDTGAMRSGGDTLEIAGVKNAMALASGIKMYHSLMQGFVTSPEGKSLIDIGVSNQGLIDIYNQEPEYWQEWNKKSVRWYNGFSHIVSSSFILAFAVWVDKTSKKRDKVNDFFEEVCMDIAINASVRVLRKRLVDDKMKKNEKLSSKYKLIYFIKTWNAYVTGKDFKQLSYSPEQEEEIKLI